MERTGGGVAHSLLVVGSIAFDSIRTPFGEAPEVLGGSATYFSVAASFFSKVRLVGVVGDDFPMEHVHALALRRIDTEGLQCIPGGKTFRWRGSYAGAMNEATTEDVQLNVFGDFKPTLPEKWRATKVVFLANGSPVTQASVLDQVTGPALVVADTMNLWINIARPALLDLLRRVDGLVLNDGEARMLAGEDNLVAAAHKILDLGPKFVVVKKGEHGAFLVSRAAVGTPATNKPPALPGDQAVGKASSAQGNGVDAIRIAVLPAFPSTVVRDPTGAGDSFAGGAMGYLASRGRYDFPTLVRALAYGTVTASFTIEDFSLRRLDRLTREEIDARLAQYRAMLKV
jgi:sugar/nucleoside kinase (ribokinase family)